MHSKWAGIWFWPLSRKSKSNKLSCCHFQLANKEGIMTHLSLLTNIRTLPACNIDANLITTRYRFRGILKSTQIVDYSLEQLITKARMGGRLTNQCDACICCITTDIIWSSSSICRLRKMGQQDLEVGLQELRRSSVIWDHPFATFGWWHY